MQINHSIDEHLPTLFMYIFKFSFSLIPLQSIFKIGNVLFSYIDSPSKYTLYHVSQNC